MASMSPRSGQFANDVSTLAQLAVAVCLAPCLDEPSDPRARDEAGELLFLAREIKADLDVFLTDEVRAEIVQVIEHLDQNRDRYRLSLLRWVDLLEEIAFYTETKWGNGAGAIKQREVRAALYYILEGFLGPEGLPTVPPWMRPILLEVVVRVTVEFLVTLDHPRDGGRPPLWQDAPREGSYRSIIPKQTRVRWAKYQQSVGERFVAFVVRIFMPRPRLTGELRTRVDAILEDWAERNSLTGTIPVERFATPIVQTALWIGAHGEEVRAAIDAMATAVYATARLSRLSQAERLEVVKEAVILMFEDLGYDGPMFRTVIRFMVDMMADATQNLFRKRGVI
ncbi:MAG TPA: hypothetical protein VF618_22415 [Thermoanaerobaculia bacterium]